MERCRVMTLARDSSGRGGGGPLKTLAKQRFVINLAWNAFHLLFSAVTSSTVLSLFLSLSLALFFFFLLRLASAIIINEKKLLLRCH